MTPRPVPQAGAQPPELPHSRQVAVVFGVTPGPMKSARLSTMTIPVHVSEISARIQNNDLEAFCRVLTQDCPAFWNLPSSISTPGTFTVVA